VVHRDIKPENLLLTSETDWDIKVSDFGLVKIADAFRDGGGRESADGSTDVDAMTAAMGRLRATTICGSSYYMAPEVYYRSAYGAPVDVWSCGIVLYILLCGSPPWEGDRIPDPEKPMTWAVPFPHEIWGQGVSAEAKALIYAMLTVDPASRPTADALLAEAWLRPPAPEPASPASPSTPALTRDRHSSLNDLSGGAYQERMSGLAEARKRRRSRVDSRATGPSPNQRVRYRGASLAAEEMSEGSSPGLGSSGMGVGMGPSAPPPYMPSSSASRFELSLLTGARSSRVSQKQSPRGERLSWLAMGSSTTSLSGLSPLGSRRDSMELEADKGRQSLVCEMPCVDEEPEGRNSAGSGPRSERSGKSSTSVETLSL